MLLEVATVKCKFDGVETTIWVEYENEKIPVCMNCYLNRAWEKKRGKKKKGPVGNPRHAAATAH